MLPRDRSAEEVYAIPQCEVTAPDVEGFMDELRQLHALASRQGHALVDQRLFLPEAWCTEAYAARRTTCAVPQDLPWQSTPQ